MDSNPGNLDFTVWLKNASRTLPFKFIVCAILTLVLLIPSLMLNSLVDERMSRRNAAIAEMNAKWGPPQCVAGPLLVVQRKALANERNVSRPPALKILPDSFEGSVDLQPEKRSRGLFETVIYTAKISLKGHFSPPDLTRLGLPPGDLEPESAAAVLGVSDIGGIVEKVSFKANGVELPVSPGVGAAGFTSAGFSVKLSPELLAKGFDFSLEMALNGSGELTLVPVGRNSELNFKSTWADPSFTGSKLPNSKKVGPDGFSAAWRIGELSSGIPLDWCLTNDNATLQRAACGAKLIITADMYQQTARSVKYAALFIVLTFVALIFAESICKVNVHPLQYALIGLALVVFYTLLLSLGEKLGFGRAYLISAAAVALQIALYAWAVFSKAKPALAMAAVLAALYGFLYILLCLDDYALIFGSIGLFIALAVMMALTKDANKEKKPA